MTTLAQLAVGQAQKEVTANDNFAALSFAGIFSHRPAGTAGLTWGFYGGYINLDGTLTSIANSTLALTNNATNYVETNRSGVVSANSSGFSADKWPLYEIVTISGVITAMNDRRFDIPDFRGRVAGISVTTADVTLSAAQARNEQVTFSGALTADRNVIVPTLVKRYTVFNGCTGGTAPLLYRLVIKTSAGTGVEVPRGSWVEAECDGTNVIAITPSQFVQTLVYAATLGAHDATNGERLVVGVLTGNITIPAPTNPRIGQELAYSFTQDATGARTITWNAAFKKAADGAGTANQVSRTRYFYDGTSWVQQGGALAWF